MTVADRGVAVAVLETRDTLAIVAWITDKERSATCALRTHRVVETVEAHIQLVGFRPSAFRVTVATTLYTAVGTDKAEMTTTHIRLNTVAMKTTL